MSETVYSEQATPAQQPASLSLTDLKVCLQVIDVCSQRGAFKPEEFAAVGALHQKLSQFLSQSEQAVQAKAAQQPAEEETPEETEDD